MLRRRNKKCEIKRKRWRKEEGEKKRKKKVNDSGETSGPWSETCLAVPRTGPDSGPSLEAGRCGAAEPLPGRRPDERLGPRCCRGGSRGRPAPSRPAWTTASRRPPEPHLGAHHLDANGAPMPAKSPRPGTGSGGGPGAGGCAADATLRRPGCGGPALAGWFGSRSQRCTRDVREGGGSSTAAGPPLLLCRGPWPHPSAPSPGHGRKNSPGWLV